MDASLKPDPERKGSYYRRIEDIDRALNKMDVERLPPIIQFLAYYFACEKLAHGIVGIQARRAATEAYKPSRRLCSHDIKSAAAALGLSISNKDLDYLFASSKEQGVLRSMRNSCKSSARVLRNNLGHDFGPTNVGHIANHAGFFIPKMTRFLACASEVLAYQKKKFSGIP